MARWTSNSRGRNIFRGGKKHVHSFVSCFDWQACLIPVVTLTSTRRVFDTKISVGWCGLVWFGKSRENETSNTWMFKSLRQKRLSLYRFSHSLRIFSKNPEELIWASGSPSNMPKNDISVGGSWERKKSKMVLRKFLQSSVLFHLKFMRKIYFVNNTHLLRSEKISFRFWHPPLDRSGLSAQLKSSQVTRKAEIFSVSSLLFSHWHRNRPKMKMMIISNDVSWFKLPTSNVFIFLFCLRCEEAKRKSEHALNSWLNSKYIQQKCPRNLRLGETKRNWLVQENVDLEIRRTWRMMSVGFWFSFSLSRQTRGWLQKISFVGLLVGDNFSPGRSVPRKFGSDLTYTTIFWIDVCVSEASKNL